MNFNEQIAHGKISMRKLFYLNTLCYHISWQVADEEDDNAVAELRKKIAVYNFGSSPDSTEGKLKDTSSVKNSLPFLCILTKNICMWQHRQANKEERNKEKGCSCWRKEKRSS